MVGVRGRRGGIWPQGLLLAHSIFWILIGGGIGYKAYKDFSILVLISAAGFAVIGVLLFSRSKFAIPANIVFSAYLICLGIFIWYKIGRPGYLIGAMLCLCSTWVFRGELSKQQ